MQTVTSTSSPTAAKTTVKKWKRANEAVQRKVQTTLTFEHYDIRVELLSPADASKGGTRETADLRYGIAALRSRLCLPQVHFHQRLVLLGPSKEVNQATRCPFSDWVRYRLRCCRSIGIWADFQYTSRADKVSMNSLT